ncbi:MAG TPA: NEW3 domain-containing protein [Candidatus Limnocylindrales bacterium]|nr:NEW3 domain-containing protein [Candidatus Limnocylindrales bacterium]
MTAKAPTQAAAASYPISVQAVAGDHQASAELAVEGTGTVQMSLASSDQRLNANASAGATRDFDVVVSNDGTSPLPAITLTGTGPSQWQIDFEPASIDQLAPGATATSTARITPSGDAVAGDYVVTLTAQTQGATRSIEVRVTVETPPIWGIIGLGLIAATLGGMLWIFRRYGRR